MKRWLRRIGLCLIEPWVGLAALLAGRFDQYREWSDRTWER